MYVTEIPGGPEEFRPRGELTVMTHTLSGAASFAACLHLFRRYPLAVSPPPPASPASPAVAGAGTRSMVLRRRGAGYFFLAEHAGGFVLRSWNAADGVEEEIRPREPAAEIVCEVVAAGLPVPRHGALLGWAMGGQVTALLTVRSAPPEIRVLALHGTVPRWHWPPFANGPLEEYRLWEYVDWGELVDVSPLVGQETGRAFWVPGGGGLRTGHIVVTGNLLAGGFWVPAGVYADHWTLREDIVPPPAAGLLARQGVTDLARGSW